MNIATKRIWSRRVLLLLGMGLIGVGAVAGYSWFYRLAPLRHILDPNWKQAHSRPAIWAEEQENYRRRNASPEMFFEGDVIGYYGDKQWTLWLVDNLKNDEEFRFCGCTRNALDLLTNQHIKGDRRTWIAWLEKHREESQEQWIQQGFANRGTIVHLPPDKADWRILLALLGDDGKDANGEAKVPGAMKYNAFRWLRDSGFNVADYVTKDPRWRSSQESAIGVCNYVWFADRYPGSDRIGLLAFAAIDTPLEFRSWMTQPTVNVIAYVIVFGGIALGAVLVVLSVRTKRRSEAVTR